MRSPPASATAARSWRASCRRSRPSGDVRPGARRAEGGPLPPAERGRRLPPAARAGSVRCCSWPRTFTGRTARRCSCWPPGAHGARGADARRGDLPPAAARRSSPSSRETLADLSRLEGITRVGLENLSADDVGAFVREATDAEATIELVTAIGELTDGTPLLVCELWRELVRARGTSRSRTSAFASCGPWRSSRGPRRIHELMEQRLIAPRAGHGAMVELAAVAGPRFELRVIGAAAGLDHGRLDPGCRAGGRRAGSSRSCPRRARVPLHARARPPRRLRPDQRSPPPELHLRVGEALEHAHAADPRPRLARACAYHFTIAAPVAGAERGVDYNLLAADAAMTSAAYDEAAARLSAALDLGSRRSTRARARAGRARATCSTRADA